MLAKKFFKKMDEKLALIDKETMIVYCSIMICLVYLTRKIKYEKYFRKKLYSF